MSSAAEHTHHIHTYIHTHTHTHTHTYIHMVIHVQIGTTVCVLEDLV
jgi:hypothetical protein